MKDKLVGIIGSGIMAGGIAEVCISSEFHTVILARSHQSAERVLLNIQKSLERLVSKEKITQDEKNQRLERLKTTIAIEDIENCDVIIETVIEDLNVKKEIFREIDELVKPETILMTNTSTLPIVELAVSAPSHVDKVVGLHFSNPAQVMPLIEVVTPVTASDEVIQKAFEFAKALNKEPIKVKDQAGFVLNGLLFPYLNNAIRLYELGVASLQDIDSAMKNGAGFPMGPFEVLDLVGLDTSLAILETLYKEYNDVNFAPRPLLKRLVAAGKLGRKTRSGFYDY